MAERGWIKLYRDIEEHWIYDFNNPLLLMIWIDILFMANHMPGKINVKNQVIEIHRGQFWTSIRRLVTRWGIDHKTVMKRLALLQSDGMIFVDSRAGYGTLITVQNYEKYQDFPEDEGNRKRNRKGNRNSHKVGTEKGTEFPHKQELKNIKNDKELKNNGLPPDDPDFFEEV